MTTHLILRSRLATPVLGPRLTYREDFKRPRPRRDRKRGVVTFSEQSAIAASMLTMTTGCIVWALSADGATERLAVTGYIVGAGRLGRRQGLVQKRQRVNQPRAPRQYHCSAEMTAISGLELGLGWGLLLWTHGRLFAARSVPATMRGLPPRPSDSEDAHDGNDEQRPEHRPDGPFLELEPAGAPFARDRRAVEAPTPTSQTIGHPRPTRHIPSTSTAWAALRTTSDSLLG